MSAQQRQVLFQQLLRRNHDNQNRIHAYCRFIRKRYHRFFANTNQVGGKQNTKPDQQVDPQPDTRSNIRRLFAMQVVKGCVVNADQTQREVGSVAPVIIKRVIALRKQKQQWKSKKKKGSSGIVVLDQNTAKSSEQKSGELRSPLPLKNITFQVLLIEKGSPLSRYPHPIKKLSSMSNLPALLLQRRRSMMQNLEWLHT